MRRKIIAAVVVGSSLLAGSWFARTHPTSHPTAVADAQKGVMANVTRGASSPASAQGLLVGVANAGETGANGDLPEIDCQTPQGDVMRVNDTSISAEAFCAQMELLTGPTPDAPTEAWHQQARQLRDKLIDVELVRAALAEEGVSIDENAVDDAMTLGRPSKTQAAASSFLRGQIRAKLEWNRLLDLRATTKISDESLRAAYARDPERYGEPARATILPYVIRLSPTTSTDDAEAARKQALLFKTDVERGDATALAKKMGLASLPVADVEEGGLEKGLAEAALELAPGQWSAPVRTKIGWVVVRVEKVRPASTLPFEEVKEKVRAMVAGELRHEAEVSLRKELREGARVEELVRF